MRLRQAVKIFDAGCGIIVLNAQTGRREFVGMPGPRHSHRQYDAAFLRIRRAANRRK